MTQAPAIKKWAAWIRGWYRHSTRPICWWVASTGIGHRHWKKWKAAREEESSPSTARTITRCVAIEPVPSIDESLRARTIVDASLCEEEDELSFHPDLLSPYHKIMSRWLLEVLLSSPSGGSSTKKKDSKIYFNWIITSIKNIVSFDMVTIVRKVE